MDKGFPPAGRARPKLAVATTFPVHPPLGGGQVRIWHLYRRLAEAFDIEIVCVGGPGDAPSRALVAPGLRQTVVPVSVAHARAEAERAAEIEMMSVTDIAMPALIGLTPEYARALAVACEGVTAVVASHPYTLPAIRAATDAPLWYEAHNVEYHLKRALLPGTRAGERLLAGVHAVERDACETASLIMACSELEAAALVREYGIDSDRVVVVANGVDLDATAYVDPDARRGLRRQLGIDAVPCGLFVGSAHPPNLQAVERIADLAVRMPFTCFLVAGGAGEPFIHRVRPGNLGLLGVVDNHMLDVALGAAEFALNPMLTGSGTNLKMVEYFAAGLPVIATPHGARGLPFEHGTHLTIAEIPDFADAIEALRAMPAEALAARVAAARAIVEDRFGWDGIARRFLDAVAQRGVLAPAEATYA